MAAENEISFFLIHGFALWSVWTFFSLSQIAMARYCKHLWSHARLIHAFSGLIVLFTTLIYGIVGFVKMKFEIKDDVHAWMGIFVLLMVSILAMSGVNAWRNLDSQ